MICSMAQTGLPLPKRWHFSCPECWYDDSEAGGLATDEQIYCGICADDTGRAVLLRRWLEPEAS